jgi:hypothetical protein
MAASSSKHSIGISSLVRDPTIPQSLATAKMIVLMETINAREQSHYQRLRSEPSEDSPSNRVGLDTRSPTRSDGNKLVTIVVRPKASPRDKPNRMKSWENRSLTQREFCVKTALKYAKVIVS